MTLVPIISVTLLPQVLQEDDTPRLWWLPAASPAAVEGPEGGGGDGPSPSPEAAGCCGVGLVWAAHRGGIDLGTPTGEPKADMLTPPPQDSVRQQPVCCMLLCQNYKPVQSGRALSCTLLQRHQQRMVHPHCSVGFRALPPRNHHVNHHAASNLLVVYWLLL
jgi:hypothetical protein